MRNIFFGALLSLLISPFYLTAQTSWKGTTSTSWSTSSNWTNGVPTSTVDAIIGDANFTGTNQPSIGTSSACKSLTLGGGSKTTTLTVNRNLTVYGAVVINSNATLNQGGATVSLTGNWTNNGTYSTTSNKSTLIFSGVSHTIGGTSTTTFRKLTINSGSTVTLAQNITVSGSQSRLTISGTLNPGETPTYLVTASAITVNSSGIIHVKATAFSGNYSSSPTLNAGSTVEYSSSTNAQTVLNTLTYSTLNISGSTTKTLAGNLNSLLSSSSSIGNININGGTLNLSSYTANRGTSVTGGNFVMNSGTTLRIGGTNTFPANFSNISLSLGSTVEYNGTAQTVRALTYGNLNLIASSGAVTKTMPSSAFSVLGNLTTSLSGGTSLVFTAAGNIAVGGNFTLAASTTYNGGSFTTTISGDLVNAGTYNGGTGTTLLNGPGKTISGAGTYNFNNLTITDANVSATATALSVAGNFATTGSAVFTHSTAGTMTFTGASKTITGTGITLNNVTINSGASLSSTSTNTITGNIVNNGTLSSSSGASTLSGASKTITGSGTTGFFLVNITGTITASAAVSVASSLNVSGTYTATSGTTTFTGTSALNGTANLFNVTINGTQLRLATNANLGIAGALTITAGTLDVTTSTPNTVTFNGSSSQNVNALTYDNLVMSNTGAKTASGSITIRRAFTVSSGATFNASTYTHTIFGNFNQSGTFNASTGTFVYTATTRAFINGVTTFNNLTINNGSGISLDLNSNVTVANLTVNTGSINTLSRTITVTNSRAGNGIILGTVTHSHSFSSGVPYTFEGPYTSVVFSGTNSVTSITVTTIRGSISGFPYGSAINRQYSVSYTGSMGSSTATARFHYEDVELNGNVESSLVYWYYNSPSWTIVGKSANDTINNYVEYSGITNISSNWTLAENASVVSWNGTFSSDWFFPGNWTVSAGTPTIPPTALEVVELGKSNATFQPVIDGAAAARSIEFYSTQSTTLSLDPGASLLTGNINGNWSQAAAHQINVGSGTLTVTGDLTLGDNTSNHTTQLNLSTGLVDIQGSFYQYQGCSLVFTGAGTLTIGEDFILSNGTVVPGTGTIKYDGIGSQQIAGINYYNLTVDKGSGVAAGINSRCVIGNTISVLNGELDILAPTEINGDVNISSTAILDGGSDTVYVNGNWNNSGTFVASLGTIVFTGSGSKNIGASTFNNFILNMSSGTASLTGPVSISGSVQLTSGTLNLSTFAFNRLAQGGSFVMSGGTGLEVSGASNFPGNFTAYTLDTTANVTYNGTVAQEVVGGISYGNLTFSNGTSNAKTLGGNVDVKGNLTINSGATFTTGANAIYLYGNWSNSGTFTPSTGSMIFSGSSKTITGNTTFNKVTITGQYTVVGSNITLNDKFQVASTGSYAAGSGLHLVNGDLINNGSLTSTGTTTFSGAAVQTIQFVNAILSVSTGIINFNGTVSPILNSNSSPTYANLNINNTGGVTASVPWRIYGDLTVGAGATFNAGNFTDTISGNVTNNGTIISSGTLHFNPTTNVTLALGTNKLTSTGTLRFGGTAQLTITGTPTTVTDIIISNTNAEGVTLPSGWTINGNLTIRSSAIFNASSYTYTISGHIESNGTLNGGTSTFIMQSADAEISANSTTFFNHFTINTGATLTINSDFNINGNFVNNGTIDNTSSGSPRLTGSTNTSISGSSTAIPQLIVAKTNATATLGINLTTVTDLSIEGGTLATSTYSITQDAGGGALTVHDYATLKLEGTNALPSFTAIELDTFSTVDYAGGTQTVTSSGVTYGNLSISASGNKTAAGALSMVGNFTLSNGTFIGGNYTHNLQGNWTMTGGTFTNTNTTINLTGPFTQTLKSTGAFANLVVNKSQNAVYDSTDITINGTLTFTSGNMITGSSYKLILPNGASISRTSGHVIGTLQKYVTTGAPTVTYEIGTTDGYAPVSLVFASVTSAGSAAVSTTTGDHADVANSQLNSAKSVNRNWTLTNVGTTFTNVGVTFNFLSGEVDGGATTSAFYVSRYNGGSWFVPTIGTRTATSTQTTGLTAMGDFVIGELYARVWDGGAGTSNWGDAANWNPDGVPTSTEGAWVQVSSSVQINSAVSIDNVKLNSASAALTLTSGGSLTVNGELNLATGVLTLNSQTLTLNGTLNASGTGTITGSANASLVIGGTNGGDFGTLRMTATSPNNRVKNFTLNRTGSNAEASIGSNGLEVTNLVTISNGILRAGGALTLISDASGTARVAQLTAPADITGSVIVQRYVPAVVRRSRMISPNVSGFDFTQIKDDIYVSGPGGATNGFDATPTNGNTIYTYQESTSGGRGWKGIPNINTTLLSGVGALVFVRGDRTLSAPQWYTAPFVAQNQVTIDFVGTLNKGSYSPTLTYTNTSSPSDDGWNLVGNPYACPINWSALTKNNLSSFYYVFDPSTNAYISNNGTQPIASGQAFFVQAIGSSPSITFTESAKVTTDVTGSFKTASNPLKIEIRKDSLTADFAWLNLNNWASKNYNPNEDAIKFTNASLNLSFKGPDAVLQQFYSAPYNGSNDTFNLYLEATTGTYTISFNHVDELPANSGVYLVDAFTNTSINLNTTSTYVFTVSSTPASYGNRFKLILNNAPLPVKLHRFTAQKQSSVVVLEWQTSEEKNNAGFEIERKYAPTNQWEKIAFVKGFNTSTPNSYTYIDEQPALTTTQYYRLKQLDVNGQYTYSSVVVVLGDEYTEGETSIYPNPAKVNEEVQLEWYAQQDGFATLQITDVKGVPVLSQRLTMVKGKNKYNLSGLAAGVYVIELNVSEQKTRTKLVVY